MFAKWKLMWCTMVLCGVAFNAQAQRVLNSAHWTTNEGAEVYFVPSHELPMLDVVLAFLAGSSQDASDWGLAALTNRLLNQGTPNATADQLAERMADVGAVYSADVARDMALVSLRTLASNNEMNAAVKTFVEMVSTPNFPQKAFAREKKAQLAEIGMANQNPEAIAAKLFYQTVYGAHPYGHPVNGIETTVKRLKPEAVTRFYNQFYSAPNVVIAIVGDVSDEAAHQLADKISRGLGHGHPVPALADVTPLTGKQVKHQTYPATQTSIRMGQAALKRNSADYFPLMVGNYTLGGGSLVSRLFDEVREKRGLSYAVYSQFQPMASAGPFVVSLGTQNAHANTAMEVADKVLGEFIATGPSVEELQDAKQFLMGNFPLSLDSNHAIAMNLVSMGFYHLPENYLDTYVASIQSVSREQIQSAFMRTLKPTHWAVISVGGDA